MPRSTKKSSPPDTTSTPDAPVASTKRGRKSTAAAAVAEPTPASTPTPAPASATPPTRASTAKGKSAKATLATLKADLDALRVEILDRLTRLEKAIAALSHAPRNLPATTQSGEPATVSSTSSAISPDWYHEFQRSAPSPTSPTDSAPSSVERHSIVTLDPGTTITVGAGSQITLDAQQERLRRRVHKLKQQKGHLSDNEIWAEVEPSYPDSEGGMARFQADMHVLRELKLID